MVKNSLYQTTNEEFLEFAESLHAKEHPSSCCEGYNLKNGRFFCGKCRVNMEFAISELKRRETVIKDAINKIEIALNGDACIPDKVSDEVPNFIDFAKRFFNKKLKPDKYQDAFFRAIAAGKPLEVHANWYRKVARNELMLLALYGMKENETFALCSPDGVQVFQLVEYKHYDGIGLPASSVTIDDNLVVIDDLLNHINKENK